MDKVNYGLYDKNYKKCPCFWGVKPADLLVKAVEMLNEKVLAYKPVAVDLGCGEGKNSVYLAKNDISVVGFDASKFAIKNATDLYPETEARFFIANMLNVDFPTESLDLVVSTGSVHCLKTKDEVRRVMEVIMKSLKSGGIMVFSSFNDRKQELEAHGEDFNPILLPHSFFCSEFKSMRIISESDLDLLDYHEDSKIEHIHSISRILAIKE